jgi:preprotein translocase subunit SecB
MKPALIQFLDYFLTDLHVSANPKFNPKKKVPLRFEDFETGVEFARSKDQKRQGKIILSLKYQPAAEANVPYRFAAEIVGELLVLDAASDELAERLFNTNGPSMLYGVLREIIRDATARGPYTGVILPSTSFYKPEDKKEAEPKPAAEQPTPAPDPAKPEDPATNP